jgi:hypothetical protein
MPEPGSAEAPLIYAAYQDQVKELFKGLFVNLQQMPANNMTEQKCIEKFATGIKKAKRARELALSAIAALKTTDSAPSKATAARSKRAKPG